MTIHAVIFDVGGVLNHHDNFAPLDPWVERLNMPTEQIFHTVFGNEMAGPLIIYDEPAFENLMDVGFALP